MSVVIRKMRETDLGQVVLLHEQRFPRSRSTRLGHSFIRRMYLWFLRYEPDLALVAEHGPRVCGFIVGSRGNYGSRLFWFSALQIMGAFISKPSLLFQRESFSAWQRFLFGLVPAPPQRGPHEEGVLANRPESLGAIFVSVASIAVDRDASGEGLFLMREMERIAWSVGADRIRASVELHNQRLIELHLRLGWIIYSRDTGGVSLLKYRTEKARTMQRD